MSFQLMGQQYISYIDSWSVLEALINLLKKEKSIHCCDDFCVNKSLIVDQLMLIFLAAPTSSIDALKSAEVVSSVQRPSHRPFV